MSAVSIESTGIHPIVLLTISDFYNRMKVTSKGKVSQVYGALMGQKVGTKVEVFSAFEFVNDSKDGNSINLDLKYIDTRRDLATQLFPKLDIVGFFSTNESGETTKNDEKIVSTLNYFGVINPIYLVLNTKNIESKNELPISAFLFNKNLGKFSKISHVIEGWESERICLETVTKGTDVQGEENGMIKNLQTTKNALAVLKENLVLIKNNLDKFKGDKKFMHMLEDLIINYPSVEKSDYQTLMKNKQLEMLLLNNLCGTTIENSYSGLYMGHSH